MTRVFKTKAFGRWARHQGLSDGALRAAVDEMERGLVEADLGGGVFKKRISRPGGGKSGGFRTIIAARLGRRAFFVEGFAKNERAGLEEDELAALRKLARDLLGMDETTLRLALERKKVTEI
jgi:hypothetical protein